MKNKTLQTRIGHKLWAIMLLLSSIVSINHSIYGANIWEKSAWAIQYQIDGTDQWSNYTDRGGTLDLGSVSNLKLRGFKVKTSGSDAPNVKGSYNVNGCTGNYTVNDPSWNDGNNKEWTLSSRWDVNMVTCFSSSSGEHTASITFQISNWGGDCYSECKIKFTYTPPAPTGYSLGGYINGADKTAYDTNVNFAFVNQGDNVWTLTRSFVNADNYFQVYDNNGECYGVSSYTTNNPATLVKNTCTEKVGATGLDTEKDYTITWNSSTKQISWAQACTAPDAKSVYIGGSSLTSQTICSTSNTYVRLAASQSGYTYQLKRYNTSTSAWNDIGDAWSSNGTGSHDFTDLSTAGKYKITGYPTGSSSSCNQDMSNTVTLYVDNKSVAGNITGAGSICSGESKTLGVSGNTGTVTQWKSSTTPDGTYSDISGATESTYSASPESTTYYKVVVKNGVCDAVTSSSYAIVTVNPAATAAEYPIKSGTDTKSYTGSPQGVTIEPVSGTGTYTVYYTGTEGTSYTKSSTAPTNVGKYSVTVNAQKGTSYCAADNLPVGTLTITKANQSTAVTISNSGTQCIPSAGGYVDISASGGNTSETITYAVVGDPDDGISLSGKRISATKAGTITVTATRPGGANYNDKTSSNYTFTFVVTPTSVSVTPASPVTHTLPSSVATPSVTQSATATHTGNQNAWTLSPNYSVNTISDASATNPTLTFKREGVYTATVGVGCENTTDASGNSATITVEPPLTIYLSGTLVSSAQDAFGDNNFPMTRTAGSYVYTRRFNAVAGSSAAIRSRKFSLRESNSSGQADYLIPKYAKVTYTNVATTGRNNDMYTTDITYSAGNTLEVRAEYKGYNSSENKPEWDISIGLVCDAPDSKTISISSESICRGSDVSVVVNNSQSGYIYTVYDAGNTQVGTTTGDGTNKSISVTRPTESTTYTVKAKQAASCTPTEMANTVSVTVNDIPTFSPTSGITQYLPVTVTSTATTPAWSFTKVSGSATGAWLSNTDESVTIFKAPTGTYTVSDGTCATGSITVSDDTETCD